MIIKILILLIIIKILANIEVRSKCELGRETSPISFPSHSPHWPADDHHHFPHWPADYHPHSPHWPADDHHHHWPITITILTDQLMMIVIIIMTRFDHHHLLILPSLTSWRSSSSKEDLTSSFCGGLGDRRDGDTSASISCAWYPQGASRTPSSGRK